MTTEPCRSCRAQILWAETDKGKPMPVDAKPTPNGNVTIHERAGKLHAVVVLACRRAALAAAEIPLYVPHFVSCPHANTWRKR